MMLPYSIRKIYHSALFQGTSFPNGYFEGWYVKLVPPHGDALAIIPGVSVSTNGDRHAFVQSIDGRTARTRYSEFPIGEFGYSRREFNVRIGESVFSRSGIEMHLEGAEQRITGSVSFDGITDIPRSVAAPGIMGWYRYVPRMECYHGVVSVDHRLAGELTLEGERIDFTGGRGYIEKDWGASFPSSWIWMQTNNFETEGVSFLLSIAKIPWLGREFIGFLSFLKTPDGFIRFATYSGASIEALEIGDEGVRVRLAHGNARLSVNAQKGKPGGLKAPVLGSMDRIIAESVSSTIEIESSGALPFRGIGRSGGLEISGNHQELTDGLGLAIHGS